MLSRTRQALGDGAGRVEAARVGVERVGGVLLSSAAVLVAAFILLVFAQLGLYRALGPGLAFALLLVFVVTLTLVPALLAILGPATFGRTTLAPRSSSAYVSLLRRPGLVAGGLVVVLAISASGFFGLRVGFDLLANLPENAPASRGYEDLTREFPGGLLSPVNVVVEGEDLDEEQDALLRLQQEMQTELLRSGELATAVLGPQYDGQIPGIDFVTSDGSAARILLVVYGAPYSPVALDQAGTLQRELPALLDQSGLEEATGVVGGQTALAAAARDTSEADLKRARPAGLRRRVRRTRPAPAYPRCPSVPARCNGPQLRSYHGRLDGALPERSRPWRGRLLRALRALSAPRRPGQRLQYLYHGRDPGGGRVETPARGRPGRPGEHRTHHKCRRGRARRFVLSAGAHTPAGLLPDRGGNGYRDTLGRVRDPDAPRPLPRPPHRSSRLLAEKNKAMNERRAGTELSRRRFISGAAALMAATTAPAWLLSCSGPQSDRRPEHVILVDWDGFDPAYLDRAPTPNLDELIDQGSLSTARATFPSLSNPSRASMATGAYPGTHENAAYYLDRQTGRVVGEERTLQAETVAEALLEEDKTIASIQWYIVQDHGAVFGEPDRLYVEPGGLFAAGWMRP